MKFPTRAENFGLDLLIIICRIILKFIYAPMKVVPLSEYMCAGLPLCEMKSLKAAIKTSDIRIFTNSTPSAVT